jgi:hypothetical protein
MVSSRGDDRGQLLLVAAIVVATAVLGGVVLLNTVHSSPDLSSQTDAQSVTNSDRTIKQMQSDLRGLFMASSLENGTRLPYVSRSGSFDAAVDAYSEEYTWLVSTNQSAVATVEHNASLSTDGAVAHANRSFDSIVNQTRSEKWAVEGADELPRMQFRIDDINSSEEIAVLINGTSPSPTVDFTISETPAGGWEVAGDLTCTGSETPVEIDLVHGVGEVTTDSTYCSVAVDEGTWDLSEYNVRFTRAASGYPDGWYAVSGEQTTTCADPCETGIVNPVFDLTYQDPNAVYSAQFTLYERGD